MRRYELGPFFQAFTMLFVLLNPFLMSIYLLDLLKRLEPGQFFKVLMRAGLIAGTVFILFAWSGDLIFQRIIQARFSAFLIFGGLIFLLIALRFVFQGSGAVSEFRGPVQHLAGAVAMPFMIGPGTISASIFSGTLLPPLQAGLAIALAMLAAVLSLFIFKLIHDHLHRSNASLLERYIDIIGRISALLIGTIAVEMIFRGLEGWLQKQF
ncbi:MAG: MarC family protein [Acidobacteria bacterium]|nr:MarC family protein [Acidobacteriota bacterium]MCB9397967.1 MarC family protein [Acidobacteriota bacterium]